MSSATSLFQTPLSDFFPSFLSHKQFFPSPPPHSLSVNSQPLTHVFSLILFIHPLMYALISRCETLSLSLIHALFLSCFLLFLPDSWFKFFHVFTHAHVRVYGWGAFGKASYGNNRC